MNILGISSYYHDAAAALIADGAIVAAAQEERFTRKKHDESFPAHAIAFVLKQARLSLADVDAVVFYDKPYLTFERLLETYHAVAPAGLRSFIAAMPVWIREKLFMRSMLQRELQKLGTLNAGVFFTEHHLSHAASAFFPSPFDEAAIITIDGVGEWATTTLCHGRGNSIRVLRQIDFPHSLGLLYSAFTAYCGFKVNSGEYKLMGLAPYGNPFGERTRLFEQRIRTHLIKIHDDGSFVLNMDYFAYTTGLTMYHEKAWKELFGIPPRERESEQIAQEYMDLAYAIQQVTEDVVLRLARTARELTGARCCCLAGGTALNCVANGKLQRAGIFDHLWIQPASGDAGGALGAALAYWHIKQGAPRTPKDGDAMQGSYLGPRFDDDDIRIVCRDLDAPYTCFDDERQLCAEVARLLDEGRVVGWFQGRMEYGPRALGNRSILGDARNPDMQKKLNLKIKFREGFRPFAPAVLESEAARFFETAEPSPYMLIVTSVKKELCNPLPPGYHDMPLLDRLYVTRSPLPAVTHIDFSARLQTVSPATNPRFHALLEAFHARTGCPVLVNTSFNVRGEPIVCTPLDAYRCFMRTEMDALVMGNALLLKEQQKPLAESSDWRKTYTLD
ncbi:MAG TPA: carbamoyltransferase [Candidatus Avidesulfovibrio excrementigallinarum]|nr:carbamoyltransferase [Candidatus Avidesulfovibrio excrementigallinarum]